MEIRTLDDMMDASINDGNTYMQNAPQTFRDECECLYAENGALLRAKDFTLETHKAMFKDLEAAIEGDRGHSGASFSWALSKVLKMGWRSPILVLNIGPDTKATQPIEDKPALDVVTG